MIKPKSKSYPEKKFPLEAEELKKAFIVLRAVNHKVRQQILDVIHRKKEITVSEIYSKLKLEQSLTSAHLAVLRKAGAVKTRREGQSIYYSVNYDQVSEIEKGAKLITGSKGIKR
jgi:DNA-binding transcriptional ArsR family regulator